jgi:hypothetical protein
VEQWSLRLGLFMADSPPTPTGPPHRGKVQAQGGYTYESVPWAQSSPPTKADVLRMLDQLEAKLTASEKRAREEAFKQVRDFVQKVNPSGLCATTSRSFPRNNDGDIRVDLVVHAGLACVPNVSAK